jgi:hypothetical protein
VGCGDQPPAPEFKARDAREMADILRISAAAAEFLTKLLQQQPEEKALVVVGVVVDSVRDWDAGTPVEDVREIGADAIRDLPSSITVEYQISTSDLKRLPPDDIYIVNGIKCYLPDDIRKMVERREVVLENGRLQFQPTLQRQEIKRDAM